MQRRQQTIFTTVHSEGAILPMDLLQRIALLDPALDALTPEAYHLLKTERLNEAINRSWNRLLSAWTIFKAAREKLPERDTGTTLTRERWLLPLFGELGYGRLPTAKAIEINDKSYPISHFWQQVPIHLVGCAIDLDRMTRGVVGAARSSPSSMVQELLNRSESSLWGFVSNGLRLRILRDNVSITRQAYVEFDLEAMMEGEVYADFVLLWLLCHQSRVESEKPEEFWLEQWSRTAHREGTRALDRLRDGVEQAIAALGSGFLAHPANTALKEKLRSGQLDTQEYYRQVLRLVYRLIVLFVAEDRDVLFHPDADEAARTRYTLYYSTARLRRLAEQRAGTRHADLFYALRLVMEKLGDDNGCRELGLPALSSFLFSREALPDIADCELANTDLLDAVRALAFTSDGRMRRVVDYRNLGAEELGSVYESLLELHPELHIDTATFALKTAGGHERKTTGSYYTPTSLINCLLDSALDPALEEAANKADADTAILNLKVCDPACGSGHFLIAAAHRIARRLAAIRTGEEEAPPEARRKALRDVIGRCIYGVDINPMSVELCKVNLWMEAIEPGKPLSFLDQHIQCGNSLLGVTPALLADGIPDSAFEPLEGDDRKLCSEFKRKNKREREGNQTLFDPTGRPWEHLGNLAASMMQLEEMGDDTVEEVRRKQERYKQLVQSSDYLFGRLLADAWCAAFVWKKNNEFAYPITEDVFRNIEKNPYSISIWMHDEILRLREQYKFFHWHLAFPDVFRVPAKGEPAESEQAGWSGGFDVVLGNPPWEHTAFDEKEWFETRRPEIANSSGTERKSKIQELAESNATQYAAFLNEKREHDGWSHIISNSNRYPLCGRGRRINTYAIFAENMRTIIALYGRLGCIVPSGIATDDTTKFFFRDLMEKRALVSLYDFENKEAIFPEVEPNYRFCLLTLTGMVRPARQGAELVFLAQYVEDIQDKQRRFTLEADDFRLFNPNTLTCPIFRSQRDVVLTKAIYQRMPVLIKEGQSEDNPWNITFRSNMFNMTSDSKLFSTYQQLEAAGWQLVGNVFHKDDEQYLPLYEGKMISHFDHRFAHAEEPKGGVFQRGSSERISVEGHKDPFYLPLPRYWVHESYMPNYSRNRHNVLLAFRKIARSTTDVRTVLCSIIPIVPSSDSLNVAVLHSELSSEILFICTAISSLSFDYIARQKIGGVNLNIFILKQLPVLPPSTYAATCCWDTAQILGDWLVPRAIELIYTAWDLASFARNCGYDRPPFRWDEARRLLLRCELDAAYFHLYGIARDDVDYIMETFSILKRDEEQRYGEYRTKRVILEIYDEMRWAMETGEPYRTRLEPPPGDATVAHEPRTGIDVQV